MNYFVSASVEELDNDNKRFYQMFYEKLLIKNEEEQHLAIPFYSLLTSMMSLQFLNYIMLSYGRNSTEIYL